MNMRKPLTCALRTREVCGAQPQLREATARKRPGQVWGEAKGPPRGLPPRGAGAALQAQGAAAAHQPWEAENPVPMQPRSPPRLSARALPSGFAGSRFKLLTGASGHSC